MNYLQTDLFDTYGTTTRSDHSDQSENGSNGNEGLLHDPHISIGLYLVSYTEYPFFWEELLALTARDTVRVF